MSQTYSDLKLAVQFLDAYNSLNKDALVNEVKKLESMFTESHEEDLADIVWSYYDYSDESLSAIMNEFSLAKSKRYLFELWHLLKTGQQYRGVLRDRDSQLWFID